MNKKLLIIRANLYYVIASDITWFEKLILSLMRKKSINYFEGWLCGLVIQLQQNVLSYAGKVINHTNMLCDSIRVNYNATVEGYCLVPAGIAICSGEIYWRKDIIS